MEFRYFISEKIVDENRNLTILDRKVTEEVVNDTKRGQRIALRKRYRYVCNDCGYDNDSSGKKWALEYDLNRGKGCPCCRHNNLSVGVNDIPSKEPWMIKFFQGGYEEAKKYSYCSGKKIKPICPSCGRVKNKPTAIYSIYSQGSIGCICEDGYSYPEKYFSNILDQLNIEYIYQLTSSDFLWCEKYRYDFYFCIDGKEYIVETHGGQHSKKDMFKTLQQQIEIDKTKRNLAYKNGFSDDTYFELDCSASNSDFIKNSIMQSAIASILDLSVVDFDKCDAFASSNLKKLVCELKRENEELTTFDIVEKTKISLTTVTKYLKEGNNLGWCKYNPKEERKKARKRGLDNLRMSATLRRGKTKSTDYMVGVFKGEECLGIFQNCAMLEKMSKDKFGIDLHKSNISEVCRGDKDEYNGYVFRYIYMIPLENNKM